MYKKDVAPGGASESQAHVQDLCVTVIDGQGNGGASKPIIEPCCVSVQISDHPCGDSKVWVTVGALEAWVAYQVLLPDTRHFSASSGLYLSPKPPKSIWARI